MTDAVKPLPINPEAPPFLNSGSKLVVERVAAFTPKAAVAVDHFTGKKVCHIFKIPAHFLTASKLKPNEAELQTNMGFVNCIGVKCAMFNDKSKMCHDVEARAAQVETARVLELIDGFLRITQNDD